MSVDLKVQEYYFIILKLKYLFIKPKIMKRKQIINPKHIINSLLILGFFLLTTNSYEFDINHEQEIKQIQNNGTRQMLPYHVLPVYGNASLGYYYVNIYVGSPQPQPQSVIIDTGSGILAMPCANCQSCGVKNHINPPYDFKKSKSSNVLTCASQNPICIDKCRFKKQTQACAFAIHYAQGSSLSGSLVQDDIRLENLGQNEQIRTVFGCTEKQTKLFFQQKANGIFGLAPKRQSNLLQQMFSRHSIINGQKKLFSLCLSSNGGVMTVGGINKQIHPDKTQPDVSVPFNDASNLYSLVGIKQISIGQMFITSIVDRIGGYGIFIDSGSTFSYIPQSKYTQVEKLLNQTCINSKKCSIGRGQDSICYKLNLTAQQNLFQQLNKLFPSIQINIQNKRIEWLPTKYMLLRQLSRNQVCMGLQPLNRYLLGANWMYDRDIVFDLNEKMVHIYDNVQCVKNNTQKMGHYSQKTQNNTPIQFTNRTTIRINTNSTTFIGAVICLSLALFVGLILLIAGLCKNSTHALMVPSEQQQEGVSKQGRQTSNALPQGQR